MIRILAPLFGSLIKFWFNAQLGPKCHPYPVDLNAELVVIFACMCPFTARPLHSADQLTFLPSCPFRAITVGAGGARVASIHCSNPLLMMSSELNFRVGSVASLHLSLDGAIMLYCASFRRSRRRSPLFTLRNKVRTNHDCECARTTDGLTPTFTRARQQPLRIRLFSLSFGVLIEDPGLSLKQYLSTRL